MRFESIATSSPRVIMPPEMSVTSATRALVRRTPDEIDRLIDIERLREILEGAALVGGNRTVEIRMCGHHDDGQLGLAVANLGE